MGFFREQIMGFVEGIESDLGLREEGLGLRNGENVGGERIVSI